MVYVRTSLRAEKRELRERMRSMGMGYRQIAAEFARVYHLRPRAAWREAYGWTLQEAAVRLNSYRGQTGLDPSGICGMTSAHLSEYENWPGNGDITAGRKPSPLLLAVLAGIYQCNVDDLIDLADRQKYGAADLLVIDTYARPSCRQPGSLPKADAGISGLRSAVACARSCSRCGRALSRYNDRDYCGGCARSGTPVAAVPADGAGVAEIGARLRAARLRRGLSLEVLAGLAGLSQSYLSMVENGKRGLDRYSLIIALADALRVLPAELAPGLEASRSSAGRAEVAVLASRRAPDISFSDVQEQVMAELTPPDWVKPVEKALVALWDAVDAADLAVMKALQEEEPADGELQHFSSGFSFARTALIGILLDALAPETRLELPDPARAVS